MRRHKRGGGWNRLPLDEDQPAEALNPDLVLAINEALDLLAAEDERLALLVKLRYFAGMTLTETAQVLNISRSTAIEDWAYARSRLRLLLSDQPNRSAE